MECSIYLITREADIPFGDEHESPLYRIPFTRCITLYRVNLCTLASAVHRKRGGPDHVN